MNRRGFMSKAVAAVNSAFVAPYVKWVAPITILAPPVTLTVEEWMKDIIFSGQPTDEKQRVIYQGNLMKWSFAGQVHDSYTFELEPVDET